MEQNFEILEEYGNVAEYKNHDKVFAKVSWYGAEPKYEIRMWDKERKKPGKGIVLTEEDLLRLKTIIQLEKQRISK